MQRLASSRRLLQAALGPAPARANSSLSAAAAAVAVAAPTPENGAAAVPKMPAFDYTPPPYDGPRAEEIFRKRAQFLSPSLFHFYDRPEPNADGDAQTCMQVNAYINRPLDAEADLRVPIEAEMSEDTADDDISSRAGNLVESMTADLAGEVTSAAGPVRLEDLQRILSAIQPSGAASSDPDAGLGLGDILKPDLVLPLIENLPIEQLASHLPEGSWTPGDIVELLQSPPLRQQLDAFTHVLRTGQIDLAQFGVDPSKYKFTVASFLEALEDSVGRGASEAGDKDAEAQRGSGNDAMDES